MKSILLFLLLTSCASVKEQYSNGVEKVSCRIECRQLEKVVDTSKDTCLCISERRNDSLDLVLRKLETLEKKVEASNSPVCPSEFSSREINPPPSVPKKTTGDPLLDILNE